MEDKELEILRNKCEEIRDKLLDNEFETDKELLKKMKKDLSKKEIEQLAMQYFVHDAISALMEAQENNESNSTQESKPMTNKDKDMYV